MRICRVSLSHFRNYDDCRVDLAPGKTILIGENAQGKSNFLEALELMSVGKSSRADSDSELVGWGGDSMRVHLDVSSRAGDFALELSLSRSARSQAGAGRWQKSIKVNGVAQKSLRGLLGHLIAVSFKTGDLNLVRGGPRFRRDWLDAITLSLKPSQYEVLSSFQKALLQRNKLLKLIAERGKLTVSDQDELAVWDRQVSRYGARVVRERAHLLACLLPLAAGHQSTLSRQSETLSASYVLRTADIGFSGQEDAWLAEDGEPEPGQASGSVVDVLALGEEELASFLARELKKRRALEIRRKQTTLGPHRDDILFALNGKDATRYASQGQQRSLVLALKLAELTLLAETFQEPPVLLLDDVLAELDTFRQGLLMGAIGGDMQSIVTTTHVSDFDPVWLADASILTIVGGRLWQTTSAPLPGMITG